MMEFQELFMRLLRYWAEKGCVIQLPYDVEKGAGTMNPETFLRVLGPKPYAVAYVEPSRRPADGRYGENPNRLEKAPSTASDHEALSSGYSGSVSE